MRSVEAEAGPAKAAPAVASTRGPWRRQAMKSRIIVRKEGSSEKYSLVLSATHTQVEFDRVLEARERAIFDEAHECLGASTPQDARRLLVRARRACWLRGSRDGLTYLVIDGELQKRARYYIFRAWAATPEGWWFLHKQDRDSKCWRPLPLLSESGAVVRSPRLEDGLQQPRGPRLRRRDMAQRAEPNGRLPQRVRGQLEPDHQPAAAGRNIT